MRWNCEALKAVAYPVNPPERAALIYQKITGDFPSNAQQEGLPPPLTSTASGAWNGLRLLVNCQSNRVEVNLTKIDPDPLGPAPVPHMSPEDLDSALPLIKNIAHRLAELPLYRVGAHIYLAQFTESADKALALINPIASNIFDPEADTVHIQYNVRKALPSTGGQMNRLLKAGVTQLASLHVAITVSGDISSAPAGAKQDVAFVHLDVNNRVVEGEGQLSNAAEVTRELWAEAELMRASVDNGP